MDKIVSLIVRKCVWNVFAVSNSCSMDLGCPLLRESSDRRLRRRAASLPPLLERTFPGSTFFSVFGAVTATMTDLVEENRFFWARHLNKRYHCQSMCKTSPSCWRRLRSLEASILGMVLTALATADYNCHHLRLQYCLRLPLSPRYWKDWAAGSSRSGLGEQLGAAVQNQLVSLAR